METIQVKTVDPISQELLKSAYRRGIQLNWERFEKLQPQDGFLRTGLSCPFGCLQGPCRIDPFGRGPDRGLCGLDRDGMVAALLLRLTLCGALEALPPGKPAPQPAWPPALKGAVSRALKSLGGAPLSAAELSGAAVSLSRPSEPAEALIDRALRLALLTLAWSGKSPAGGKKSLLPLSVGYGLLARGEINLAVSGQPSPQFLKALLGEVSRGLSGRGQVVSLGEFIAADGGYLPCVCTCGEAELALSSGKISLLIAAPGADPALAEFCRTQGIPCVPAGDPKSARDLVQKAKAAKAAPGGADFLPQPSPVEEAQAAAAPAGPAGFFKKGPAKKLALLGGCDHLYHPLGWIPAEVTPALLGRGFSVSGWGDAALWMVKKGLASPKAKTPLQVLGGQQGPSLALQGLADSGRLKDVKGVCFTGLKSCRDLALALGMAGLGLRVAVAVPLPLWGSEKARNLLSVKLAAAGGRLTHFDHPAQAEEILDWFLGD